MCQVETSNMILLKGEPKTFQIKSVKRDNRNVFWVTFSDKRTFPYRQRDIVFLSSSVEINVEDNHLTRADRCLSPKRAWVFTHGFKKFYPTALWLPTWMVGAYVWSVVWKTLTIGLALFTYLNQETSVAEIRELRAYFVIHCHTASYRIHLFWKRISGQSDR